MRAVLPCALLLASCAKGGIEIVVDARDASVDKVRLFVGVGDAYTDPIMPKTRALPFATSVAFARDDNYELDVREVVAGENAVFQFQGEGTLGVVIAVGMHGDVPVTAGMLNAIDVPSDYVARYPIKLDPVNTTGSTLELDIWEPTAGSPKAGAECVALYDKATQKADAVVTAGDPDCDGWPTGDAKECQPDLYMSFKRPALQDAACLVAEVTPTNMVTACVLGGPGCADGHGVESACNKPTAFCTPLSVCNQCRSSSDPFTCARDVANNGTFSATRIQCKLYVGAGGTFCQNTLLALDQPPANIAGHYCKTGGEYPLITAFNQAWNSKVSYQRLGTQLTIAVNNVQSNCNFEITAAGSIPTALTGSQFFGGMVAGMLDNGRGIAVPIVFEVNPQYVGCDIPNPTCQTTWSWDPGELVDACVNAPVFPP